MRIASCASIMEEKKRNIWKSKNLENNKKSRNLENIEQSWKSSKIKKYIGNSQHFQISKISDFKKNRYFQKKSGNKIHYQQKISKSFFPHDKNILIEISRTIYFEHSFDSKTHVCDIRRDLAIWPILYFSNIVHFIYFVRQECLITFPGHRIKTEGTFVAGRTIIIIIKWSLKIDLSTGKSSNDNHPDLAWILYCRFVP